jgi:hypothetical protein
MARTSFPKYLYFLYIVRIISRPLYICSCSRSDRVAAHVLYHASRTGIEYIHYTSVIQGPHKLRKNSIPSWLEKPRRVWDRVIVGPVGWTVAKRSRNPRPFINWTNQSVLLGPPRHRPWIRESKQYYRSSRHFGYSYMRFQLCTIRVTRPWVILGTFS